MELFGYQDIGDEGANLLNGDSEGSEGADVLFDEPVLFKFATMGVLDRKSAAAAHPSRPVVDV